MTTSELIYEHALRDIGLKEIDGAASNPRIKLAISFAADWLDKDDSKTAWCGCIRGLWAHETQTGSPAAYYRAINWSKWGNKITNLALAKQGDTVILGRTGGYHVGLFSSWDGKSPTFKLLGGNQSNQCSIASMRVDNIVSIRRAKTW